MRNPEKALHKTKELIGQGFGVLEVCGAFEQKLVDEIQRIAQEKLCIGRVAYTPEQEEALERYWMS